MMRFDDLQEKWAREAAEVDIELWWLADDIRKELPPDTTEALIRNRTLEALEPLLESGRLRAVDILSDGSFIPWPGTVFDQLVEIRSRWEKLGRKPNIGDVVALIGPR